MNGKQEVSFAQRNVGTTDRRTYALNMAANMNDGIHTFTSRDTIALLREPWNAAVVAHAAQLHGPDVTSTWEWTNTLWEQRVHDKDALIVTLWGQGNLEAILPLFSERIWLRGIPCRRLSPIHELYSGRTGIVSTGDKTEAARAMFGELVRRGGWHVLDITVVTGSPSEMAIMTVARELRLGVESEPQAPTPYIMLDKSWDEFFAALPRKFRYRLRNAAKRFSERGQLSYQAVTTPEELPAFVDAMLEVEHHSWKEDAGTSITTNAHQEAFYRQLLVRAAEAKWFSGHLLRLDGRPIAYDCGLEFAGVYYDLKTSYCDEFRELSPGNLLKTYLLPCLMGRGVAWYDFRGVCDGFKLRWTDKIYHRTQYRLFAPGMKTRLIQALGNAKRRFKSTPDARSVPVQCQFGPLLNRFRESV